MMEVTAVLMGLTSCLLLLHRGKRVYNGPNVVLMLWRKTFCELLQTYNCLHIMVKLVETSP